jgi:8-oxo-dGTP diphosphatase
VWNVPGGRVEAGETPWQAVVREVEEEVGLRVDVEQLLGVYSVPSRTDVVFNFLCKVTGGDFRLSNEADDIQWFAREAIPENTSVRQKERIEDAYTRSVGRVLLKLQA